MEAEMLLSKHQAFLGDLEKHAPTFEATMDYGKELQAADHYGSNVIEARFVDGTSLSCGQFQLIFYISM